MDWYCTTDKYNALYARWLTNPGGLLDAAKYVPGQVLMDLCGGTGAVSLEALRRGAPNGTVLLADFNPRCPDSRIEQIQGDADQPWSAMWRIPVRSLDLIVIRQAAAYLRLDQFMLNWWRCRLRENGKLVFNLFSKPRWSFKTYKFGGRRFFEASWYFGRTVHHMQAALGIGIDFTRFTWTPTEELRARLNSLFMVEVIDDGRSQKWICTPRQFSASRN